ncbi:MAG: DNA polymerase III subunit beta [Patescibacteria group bacterium]|nr:DNA polymerase III subunit beta [Patescibacteria group bacterium]
MEISLKKKRVKNGLNFLKNSIPSNPQLPILSNIRLKLQEKTLTLSATDLYLGVKTRVEVSCKGELDLVVPGSTFKDLIYSFENKEIHLEKKDKSIIIKAGSSKVNIPFQNSDEYPDFPKVEGEEFKLKAKTLEEIKNLVSFAASSDQARPVLTTVLLKCSKQGLEAVATDGFRLAVLKFDELKTNKEKALLIPVKALNEVSRIVSQTNASEAVLQVSEELKQIKFKVESTEIFVRLIEGDFPPYEKIIPSSFSSELKIEGKRFKKELSRAYILAKESSSIVRLKFEKELLEIKTASTALGKYRGEMEVKNKQKDSNEIAFNANYLIDFLNNVKSEEVIFKMNESLKPAIIQVKERENYKYIIMPFRINEN